MRKLLTNLGPMSIVLLVITGCNTNDVLVATMQESFIEQFGSACASNQQCLRDLDAYATECFDRTLALEAIGADRPSQTRINTLHIRKFQTCVTAKSGVDHWGTQDMPAFILSQAKG